MLNQVNLVGRMSSSTVNLHKSKTGKNVGHFVVATNGRQNSKAQFHAIRVFDKLAENCFAYLETGQQVVITGRLTYDEWVDAKYTAADGSPLKRERAVIIANNVTFGAKSRRQKATTEDTSVDDEVQPPARVASNGRVLHPTSAGISARGHDENDAPIIGAPDSVDYDDEIDAGNNLIGDPLGLNDV